MPARVALALGVAVRAEARHSPVVRSASQRGAAKQTPRQVCGLTQQLKITKAGNDRSRVVGGAATLLTFLSGALSYSGLQYGHAETTLWSFFC